MVKMLQTKSADCVHLTAADPRNGPAQCICNAAEWLHPSVAAEYHDVSLYSRLTLYKQFIASAHNQT